MSDDLRLYTLEEVAAILHAPLGTVKYWRAMRRLAVVKAGRRPLVEHGELMAFIERSKETKNQTN